MATASQQPTQAAEAVGLEAFQILAPDGAVQRPELMPDLETVERFYRQMARARHFDDRMAVLVSQGKMGKYPQFAGQEASQIGSILALEPGDYVAPMYRSTGALLAYGWPMKNALMYWRGHPEGWRIPDNLNMLPIIIDIAAQFPHAAGAALGLKLQGIEGAVMTYIGEGGTSQGDFHAGLNFAAATDAPAVFVIENNGYAISVPRAVQSKVDYLVRRAEGYGIPGHLVDGNDVLAVNHVAQQAVERARRGDGPTLVEHLTYRLRPHTTGDDPKKYRDEAVTKEWGDRRDPIQRVKAFLEREGHWNDDRETAMRAEVESEFAAALEAADEAPPPHPRALLEYVFAAPTGAVEAQRGVLEARVAALEAQ